MAPQKAAQASLPTTVVAIDFGTAATGYCIAQAPPSGSPITSARVFPFKPGDRGAAATEKNLTSVLLDAESMAVVGFGREARRRFYEMDPEDQKGFMYLEQFKMAMAPSRRGKLPLSQRKVHALGADIAIPLSTATAKVLEAVRIEALDRLKNLGVTNLKSIGWCLTVPAIWDDEAKAFMREAAELAGIPAESLSLCLEPEGAIIAAMSEAAPEIQRKLKVGSGVMILDCGGGTVDVTVSNVVATEPYALQEILPASGDAWGGTLVDAEFRKFANTLLCPPGSTNIPSPEMEVQRTDPAALASMMDSWESAKVGWDTEDPAASIVKVQGLAGVCEAIGGPQVLQDRVTAFNDANGFTGAEAVVYKPRAFALWLPPALVQTFFDRCVANITAHVLDLFAESEDAGHPVHFVFLVGGFAESVYLQRSVRAALIVDPGSPPVADLIVPNKPVQSVNRGSALWALYPKFITARISKYTYVVDLAELYDPYLHDPLPHRRYLDGESNGTLYCRHVLVPLVQRGDEVSTDASVTREVSPLLISQTSVSFDIFRLNTRLPPLEAGYRRAFLWEDDIDDPPLEHLKLKKEGAGGAGVANKALAGITQLVKGVVPTGRAKRAALRAGDGRGDDSGGVVTADGLPMYLPVVRPKEVLATVRIEVGTAAKNPGKNGRMAELSLFFGKTEITAAAFAKSTGQRKECSIQYNG